MARPRKAIDPEQVKQLAMIGCSVEEMASVLGVHERTIQRRFATPIKEGRLNAKASLRRKQFEMAMKGNPTMLVWLGKQWLDQKDKQEHTGAAGGPIQFEDVNDGDLDERIKKLTQELYGSEIDEAGRTGISAARETEAAGGK